MKYAVWMRIDVRPCGGKSSRTSLTVGRKEEVWISRGLSLVINRPIKQFWSRKKYAGYDSLECKCESPFKSWKKVFLPISKMENSHSKLRVYFLGSAAFNIHTYCCCSPVTTSGSRKKKSVCFLRSIKCLDRKWWFFYYFFSTYSIYGMNFNNVQTIWFIW